MSELSAIMKVDGSQGGSLTQLLTNVSSTPIAQKRGASETPIHEYSPVLASRSIDVVWDRSPLQSQSCKRSRKGLRRRILFNSKVAPKRVQAAQLQSLEKLEEELQLLKDANNNTPEADFADDSFDSALSTFTEVDIELLSQALPVKVKTEANCYLNKIKNKPGAPLETPVKCSLRDIELKRLEALAKLKAKRLPPEKIERKQLKGQAENMAPVKCSSEEIEKKRLEALAKLSKKKYAPASKEGSAIKCSPEEIELKRREALAKLEAKKRQDIIERNRLAALEKLKMTQKCKTVT